mgnify:CR=1 FL=1
MFFLYQIIVSVLIIISPIIILYRLIKKKEDLTRFKEKFCFPTKKRIKGKLIWFHGASIGEIMSIVPLIKNYEKDSSIKQILLTSSTLSSSKIIKKFKFKKTTHQFYPIDHFFFTNKFIKYWSPSIAIFIESEIWPCMFKNLNNKGIQLILLNARLTKKTFKKWMSIKSFAINIFNNISIAYPQNLETLFFLKQMNLRKINLIGNLKFAEKNDEKLNNLNSKLNKQLKRKKIWVASSTHKNEEIFCAKTHIELKKKINNILTIIIPRHIHRVNEIKKDIQNLNLKIAYHSNSPNNLDDIDIYIVDTFGETKRFHKYASSVFLGGSIANRGGQNPLEAARYGAKILHGPNTDNFKDVYKLLRSLNISKKVNSTKELASLIIFKKNKNTAKIIKNIGEKILKKTIKELDRLIINELKET